MVLQLELEVGNDFAQRLIDLTNAIAWKAEGPMLQLRRIKRSEGIELNPVEKSPTAGCTLLPNAIQSLCDQLTPIKGHQRCGQLEDEFSVERDSLSHDIVVCGREIGSPGGCVLLDLDSASAL